MDFESSSISQFKEELIQTLSAEICPLGESIRELRSNPQTVIEFLDKGKSLASDEAERNLRLIKRSLGLHI